MKDALSKAERCPMLYSLNNGLNDTNTDNANMWRTTPDTGNTFSSMVGTAMLNDINSKAYTPWCVVNPCSATAPCSKHAA